MLALQLTWENQTNKYNNINGLPSPPSNEVHLRPSEVSSKEMCDEFVCSDSGVVSLCDDDRKLLASLGKKSQQIPDETQKSEKEEAELSENNNVESETNRNFNNTNSQEYQQGIDGVTLTRTRYIL